MMHVRLRSFFVIFVEFVRLNVYGTSCSSLTHLFMRIVLLGLSLALTLAACTSAPIPDSSSSSSSSSVSSVSNVYDDTDIGYSIVVPSGWTILKNTDVTTAEYTVEGTAFIAPADMTGTTLNEARFHIAQIPSCPVPSVSGSTSETIEIDGIDFQRTSWSGVGAGNLYEGYTYTAPTNDACIVLTGFLHSCNLGVDCGENHSAPFDTQAYFSTFDTMARSMKFVGTYEE